MPKAITKIPANSILFIFITPPPTLNLCFPHLRLTKRKKSKEIAVKMIGNTALPAIVKSPNDFDSAYLRNQQIKQNQTETIRKNLSRAVLPSYAVITSNFSVVKKFFSMVLISISSSTNKILLIVWFLLISFLKTPVFGLWCSLWNQPHIADSHYIGDSVCSA